MSSSEATGARGRAHAHAAEAAERGALRRWVSDRALVFATALAVRVAVAWTFFGCCDMWSDLDACRYFYSGRQVVLPYLPGVQLFLWLGGGLATHTALPLTFCFKLFQIVADAGVSVLVYDICRRRSGAPIPGGPLAGGLLYALSPVAIFVSAFHAQWDPIFLFFMLLAFYLKELPSVGSRFLAGVSFLLGIIVKPIPLLLLPCLFTLPSSAQRSSTYVRRELSILAGLLACLGAYSLVSAKAGYDVLKMLPGVVDYAKSGYPLLGLPVEAFHKNRYWLLLGIAIILFIYARRKLDVYGASLLVFTLLIGTCGLAPQYLVWPLPFAIITRRNVFLAVYGAFSAAFMFLFFSNPNGSGVAYENMGTFATLKGASWLIPRTGSEELVPFIHRLGAYAVPLSALGLLVFVVARALVSRRPSSLLAPPPATKDYVARFAPWTYAALLAVMAAGGAYAKSLGGVSVGELEGILADKVARYEVAMHGRYYVVPESYEAKPSGGLTVLTLAAGWASAWSVAAVALVLAGRARRKWARAALTEPSSSPG